jgi:hypothetical protein
MDADDLYGLPLDRFVAERGSLARALRTQGRREQAAAIAGLRKPSVAAWAVNQLVRTQRRSVAGLFDAGDALRKAQDDLLAGRIDGRALRAAAERERAAADLLVTAARGLLSSAGHQLSDVILDRVAETLHAAALDDQPRDALQAGRLERELRHVGLGVGADIVPAPDSAPNAAPQPKPAKQPAGGPTLGDRAAERAAAKRAAAERAAAERAAAEREEQKAARAAESEARREADRAARALAVAEQRRERAAEALHDADAALTAARVEADRAADAHHRAQEKLHN